jgi:hypothetical protein
MRESNRKQIRRIHPLASKAHYTSWSKPSSERPCTDTSRKAVRFCVTIFSHDYVPRNSIQQQWMELHRKVECYTSDRCRMPESCAINIVKMTVESINKSKVKSNCETATNSAKSLGGSDVALSLRAHHPSIRVILDDFAANSLTWKWLNAELIETYWSCYYCGKCILRQFGS